MAGGVGTDRGAHPRRMPLGRREHRFGARVDDARRSRELARGGGEQRLHRQVELLKG